MDESPGIALSLTRFLLGAWGSFFFQGPALLLGAPFEPAVLASVLTGAFCARLPSPAWIAPAAYLALAALVLLPLVMEPSRRPEAPPRALGAMFGAWALLAAVFVFVSLRRRRSAAFDAFLASRREKKSPPTA